MAIVTVVNVAVTGERAMFSYARRATCLTSATIEGRSTPCPSFQIVVNPIDVRSRCAPIPLRLHESLGVGEISDYLAPVEHYRPLVKLLDD